MVSSDIDSAVRAAAFQFLVAETRLSLDGTLPRTLLEHGFQFMGKRVPLVSPQGIFKPAVLPEVPLSITTKPVDLGVERPYDDRFDGEVLLYRYRGTDLNHRDNVGLRRAMRDRIDLVYFAGVERGHYMPFWPVRVVDDDPKGLCFMVDVNPAADGTRTASSETIMVAEVQRRYVATSTLHRLHQQTFRRQVIRAYHERCAICRLGHRELLDAAHILPDTDPQGMPVISNGLSLCTLHHAAYDRNIIGVNADLIVHVREDVRNESDGPMLRHGLQGFHGERLHVPRPELQRPKREFLDKRYQIFKRGG